MPLLVLISLIRHTELGVFAVVPALYSLPNLMTELSNKIISQGLAMLLLVRYSSHAYVAAWAAPRGERALTEIPMAEGPVPSCA
jgi:hypothetical protein